VIPDIHILRMERHKSVKNLSNQISNGRILILPMEKFMREITSY